MLLPRGQIFYDATCGLCTGTYRRFGAMTERVGFSWVPMQDARVRDFLGLEPGDDVPGEIKLLTRKGRLLGGIDAVACVCKYVWWLRPIWLMSRVPGLHGLMAIAYRWITRNRKRLAGTCAYDPASPVQRAA